MAWCPRAPSSVPHTEGGLGQGTPNDFGPRLHACDGSSDDGSRWRCPDRFHGQQRRTAEWVRRLGACCRCVSLHHGLGLWPAAYKDVTRSFVHQSAAPLGLRHPRSTLKCAIVLDLFVTGPKVARNSAELV